MDKYTIGLFCIMFVAFLLLIAIVLICATNAKSIKHMTGKTLDNFAKSIKLKRVYYGVYPPKIDRKHIMYKCSSDKSGRQGFYENDNDFRLRIATALKGKI